MNKNCNKLVKKNMMFRLIITIIIFYLLSINKKFINSKNKYLLLATILFLLDSLDTKNKIILPRNIGCLKLFYYQNIDKLIDLISYLLLFLFFEIDVVLLLIILYRMLGVVLFYITKDSKWLIIFFDFVKEYLVYLFIFSNNYKYLTLFIISKILFEYYHHSIVNPNNYKNK